MAKRIETMEVGTTVTRDGMEHDVRLTVGILSHGYAGHFNPMTGVGCAPEGPEFEIHGATYDPSGLDFRLTDAEAEDLLETMWDTFCEALGDWERARTDDYYEMRDMGLLD
jgi:hypothetical protein